jgi:hypothetical protein
VFTFCQLLNEKALFIFFESRFPLLKAKLLFTAKVVVKLLQLNQELFSRSDFFWPVLSDLVKCVLDPIFVAESELPRNT